MPPSAGGNKKPRINVNAKLSKVKPKIDDNAEHRCTCCGKVYKRQQANYTVSRSPLHMGNNGFAAVEHGSQIPIQNQIPIFFSHFDKRRPRRNGLAGGVAQYVNAAVLFDYGGGHGRDLIELGQIRAVGIGLAAAIHDPLRAIFDFRGNVGKADGRPFPGIQLGYGVADASGPGNARHQGDLARKPAAGGLFLCDTRKINGAHISVSCKDESGYASATRMRASRTIRPLG